MKVTRHAVKRFCERALKDDHYSFRHRILARRFLERVSSNMQITKSLYDARIEEFDNIYMRIVENKIVTVIDKN